MRGGGTGAVLMGLDLGRGGGGGGTIGQHDKIGGAVFTDLGAGGEAGGGDGIHLGPVNDPIGRGHVHRCEVEDEVLAVGGDRCVADPSGGQMHGGGHAAGDASGGVDERVGAERGPAGSRDGENRGAREG